MKKFSLTLAGANTTIAKYLNSARFLNTRNKAFLLHIQNRIHAIHSTQRGWLKVGGLIANAHVGIKDRTQPEFTQEAINF